MFFTKGRAEREGMLSQAFQKELEESGYLHRPLPLHPERSMEAVMEQKEVLEKREIWKKGMALPLHSGIGSISIVEQGTFLR